MYTHNIYILRVVCVFVIIFALSFPLLSDASESAVSSKSQATLASSVEQLQSDLRQLRVANNECVLTEETT